MQAVKIDESGYLQMDWADGLCLRCFKPLRNPNSTNKGGRPSVYCSNACKQYAYRQRAKDTRQ